MLFLKEFFQRFSVLLHFRIQLSDQSDQFTFCRASFFIDLVLALLDLEEDLLPKCFSAPLNEVKPLTHFLRELLHVSEHFFGDERLEIAELLRHKVLARITS